MKVSVVVTVYNLERYIHKSIMSVINQTYDNLEIIVVDDCSTDASASIIASFGSQVKYIKTSVNGGVLLATCLGLKLATGDIITFLDGDDIWLPNKIMEVVNLYKSNDQYVLISHDYDYIDENSIVFYPGDNTQEELRLLSQKNDNLTINNIMREGVKFPCGVIWLGSAYSINTHKFNVKAFLSWVDTLKQATLVYQDWPLATFVMASSNGLFGYVNIKLFQYRLHQYNYSGGSGMTLDKAKKVALKGLETSNSIMNIMELFRDNFSDEDFYRIKNFRENMAQEYLFLINVYNRNLINAVRILFKLYSNKYLTRQMFFKHLLRLITFGIFGSKFFNLKHLLIKFKRKC